MEGSPFTALQQEQEPEQRTVAYTDHFDDDCDDDGEPCTCDGAGMEDVCIDDMCRGSGGCVAFQRPIVLRGLPGVFMVSDQQERERLGLVQELEGEMNLSVAHDQDLVTLSVDFCVKILAALRSTPAEPEPKNS